MTYVIPVAALLGLLAILLLPLQAAVRTYARAMARTRRGLPATSAGDRDRNEV